MSGIKKGSWVQIHETVLKPEDRPGHLPQDTKKVPLELWIKGFINSDSELGKVAEITTVTGRTVQGTLVEINPGYNHDFGQCIPELLHIGQQLRELLEEVE